MISSKNAVYVSCEVPEGTQERPLLEKDVWYNPEEIEEENIYGYIDGKWVYLYDIDVKTDWIKSAIKYVKNLKKRQKEEEIENLQHGIDITFERIRKLKGDIEEIEKEIECLELEKQ